MFFASLPVTVCGPAAKFAPESGSVVVTCAETVGDEARWVAGRLRQAWDELGAAERTAAVLVRRRGQIPLLAAALLEVGLPVEVVGLGGLLTMPEIIDRYLRLATGAIDGSETALQVTFTGLDPEAQRRALASFPGARRFVLAAN